MPIRRATVLDAQPIAEVHVRTWQVAYRGLLPDSYLAGLSIPRRVQAWTQLLEDSDQDTFVAEDQAGEIVGFANLVLSRDSDAPPNCGELASIYVDPAHWGLGHGRLLIRAVLDAAKARGFRRLTLWVLDTNQPAQRFYEAMGFSADGAKKTETLPGDVTLHELRYLLDLTENE